MHQRGQNVATNISPRTKDQDDDRNFRPAPRLLPLIHHDSVYSFTTFSINRSKNEYDEGGLKPKLDTRPPNICIKSSRHRPNNDNGESSSWCSGREAPKWKGLSLDAV